MSISPLRPQEPCTGAMSDLLTAVILACIYSSAYHARDYDPIIQLRKTKRPKCTEKDISNL